MFHPSLSRHRVFDGRKWNVLKPTQQEPNVQRLQIFCWFFHESWAKSTFKIPRLEAICLQQLYPQTSVTVYNSFATQVTWFSNTVTNCRLRKKGFSNRNNNLNVSTWKVSLFQDFFRCLRRSNCPACSVHVGHCVALGIKYLSQSPAKVHSSTMVFAVKVRKEFLLQATIQYLGVSKNKGTPKSSILRGFSVINHPFWGTPIFGNPHISLLKSLKFTNIIEVETRTTLTILLRHTGPGACVFGCSIPLGSLENSTIRKNKVRYLPIFKNIIISRSNCPCYIIVITWFRFWSGKG